MKFIFLTILATIIVFFVWNMLKRIFFTKFYQNFPIQAQEKKEEKKKEEISQKINWEAETIDYEEVKDEKYDQK